MKKLPGEHIWINSGNLAFPLLKVGFLFPVLTCILSLTSSTVNTLFECRLTPCVNNDILRELSRTPRTLMLPSIIELV